MKLEQKTNLPLSRHVSVTSRNTNEERIVSGKNIRGNYGVIGLRRGMHLGKDFVGQSLLHPDVKGDEYLKR